MTGQALLFRFVVNARRAGNTGVWEPILEDGELVGALNYTTSMFDLPKNDAFKSERVDFVALSDPGWLKSLHQEARADLAQTHSLFGVLTTSELETLFVSSASNRDEKQSKKYQNAYLCPVPICNAGIGFHGSNGGSYKCKSLRDRSLWSFLCLCMGLIAGLCGWSDRWFPNNSTLPLRRRQMIKSPSHRHARRKLAAWRSSFPVGAALLLMANRICSTGQSRPSMTGR